MEVVSAFSPRPNPHTRVTTGRAIRGVADHFGQLRQHLVGIVKSISLLRALKRLLRWICTLLGIPLPRALHVSAEELAAEFRPPVLPGGPPPPRVWPLILFFVIAFGGPYLVYKLLMEGDGVPNRSAAPDARQPVQARAGWDYTAADAAELSFRAGDMLTVYPPTEAEPQGWLRAALDGRNGYGARTWRNVSGCNAPPPPRSCLN